MALKIVPQAVKQQIQIGKLRHRIQIVGPSSTQDSMGGWNINVDTVVWDTWGTIEALTGAEKFMANQFGSTVTHSVMVRHPRSAVPAPGIVAKMQVWFNQRQFQIEAVLNHDETQRFLQLLCIEINDSLQQASGSPSEGSL